MAYGFRLVGTVGGGMEPAIKRYRYEADEASTAIFVGDQVIMDADSGTVDAQANATNADTLFVGICVGLYDANRTPVKTLLATVDGYVDVCIDPHALYVAEIVGTSITEADINANADGLWGTGNAYTKQSGHSVSATTDADQAMWRILGRVEAPNNNYGDATMDIYVTPNEHTLKSLTGTE